LSRHCSKTSKISARYAQITFGHTHISTTQQIYTYFNEAASRDATAMARVTESNYRPSPYHGVPIGFLARDFGERPDQRLYFSSVGTGSGRFAPDATSQIPPNR
jgi:hypothetical protein